MLWSAKQFRRLCGSQLWCYERERGCLSDRAGRVKKESFYVTFPCHSSPGRSGIIKNMEIGRTLEQTSDLLLEKFSSFCLVFYSLSRQ